MSESVSFKPLVVELYTAVFSRAEQQEIERLARMVSWYVHGATPAWVEMQVRYSVRSGAGVGGFLGVVSGGFA